MVDPQVYSEVYEILKYMNKEDVMKIPLEILKNIKDKRDLNYKSKIDKKDLFNPNNVLNGTIEALNWIDINFWMTEEEKQKIQRYIRQREFEEEKRKKQRFNSNIVFTKKYK